MTKWVDCFAALAMTGLLSLRGRRPKQSTLYFLLRQQQLDCFAALAMTEAGSQ
jgi:hypothetical protein